MSWWAGHISVSFVVSGTVPVLPALYWKTVPLPELSITGYLLLLLCRFVVYLGYPRYRYLSNISDTKQMQGKAWSQPFPSCLVKKRTCSMIVNNGPLFSNRTTAVKLHTGTL
jgi:hypothetical protein